MGATTPFGGVIPASPSSGGGSGDLLAANNLSDVASAATSATNLGVGTGSSPQFAGVNVGHATDSTLTRVSAGLLAVEGVTLCDVSTAQTLANKTLTAPILGTPASGTLTNCTGAATAQNNKSAAYTTVLGDANTILHHPSTDNNARTFTIDSNANVAYPVGTMIAFSNMINTVTIAITSDTMYLAGTGTTGSRTLAVYGVAVATKMTTTTWIISGTGLT